jgi:hypothetical protein
MAVESAADTQEMDMDQDDDEMNTAPTPPSRPAPPPPMMLPRAPFSQPSLHMGLPNTAMPPPLPTDRLGAPLKPQDVIIKSYDPKGTPIRSTVVLVFDSECF